MKHVIFAAGSGMIHHPPYEGTAPHRMQAKATTPNRPKHRNRPVNPSAAREATKQCLMIRKALRCWCLPDRMPKPRTRG
jgi:hypothetical protein